MCSATIADVSEGERKKAEKRQLARFVVGWKDVVEFLGRRFSVSVSSSSSCDFGS